MNYDLSEPLLLFATSLESILRKDYCFPVWRNQSMSQIAGLMLSEIEYCCQDPPDDIEDYDAYSLSYQEHVLTLGLYAMMLFDKVRCYRDMLDCISGLSQESLSDAYNRVHRF